MQISSFLLSPENMIECQERQQNYFFDVGFDPEKCRIVSQQHTQKLTEFIVRTRFEWIDYEIENEFEHFVCMVKLFFLGLFGRRFLCGLLLFFCMFVGFRCMMMIMSFAHLRENFLFYFQVSWFLSIDVKFQ